MTFTSRGSANTSGLTNTVVNDGTLILDYTQSSSKLCDTGTVTLNAGLAWEITGLTSNGSIKVVNAVAAAPQIGSVTLSGSNLLLTGSGGTAGADYWVLTSTNLTLPRASWTSIATNQFITGGNFNFTNAVDPATPALFYLLQVP